MVWGFCSPKKVQGINANIVCFKNSSIIFPIIYCSSNQAFGNCRYKIINNYYQLSRDHGNNRLIFTSFKALSLILNSIFFLFQFMKSIASLKADLCILMRVYHLVSTIWIIKGKKWIMLNILPKWRHSNFKANLFLND